MSSFWDGSGHIYVMSQPNRPDLWDWRALWLTVRWHPPASVSIRQHPPVYPPTSVSCSYPSPPQVKPDLLVDRVSKLNLSSCNASPGPAFPCPATTSHKTGLCLSPLPPGDGDLELQQERCGSELHRRYCLPLNHRSTFCISSSILEAVIRLTVGRRCNILLHRC